MKIFANEIFHDLGSAWLHSPLTVDWPRPQSRVKSFEFQNSVLDEIAAKIALVQAEIVTASKDGTARVCVLRLKIFLSIHRYCYYCLR